MFWEAERVVPFIHSVMRSVKPLGLYGHLVRNYVGRWAVVRGRGLTRIDWPGPARWQTCLAGDAQFVDLIVRVPLGRGLDWRVVSSRLVVQLSQAWGHEFLLHQLLSVISSVGFQPSLRFISVSYASRGARSWNLVR